VAVGWAREGDAERDAENDLAGEIKAARIRLQESQGNGTGYCIDCDRLIPRARLQAIPGAQRCAPCQQDYEDGE